MNGLLVIGVIICLAINYCSYRYLNNKEISKIPMPDIIHDKLPCLEDYYMNDVLTLTIFIFASFSLNILQAQKFTLIFIILYIIRALTIVVTHIPAVNKKCVKAIFNSCHDLMFSGHTAMTVVSLMSLHYWHGLSLFVAVPYYLVTIFFILAQRRHYTTDVLMASVLSFSVFHNLK